MKRRLSGRSVRWARAVAVGLALAAPGAAVTAPAAVQAQAVRGHGDPQAEAFVQSEANRALQILNSPAPVEAKEREIYAFVNQVADVPRITDFVLGKYRRSLTSAQYQEFARVFRQYADRIYEERLRDYRGERLRVTGSVVRRPGDVIVGSEVVGGDFRSPSPVNWRVIREPDGSWRVVDVEAEGVWLAITEQTDFNSTLDNAHGDIDVLINQLRAELSRPPADNGR